MVKLESGKREFDQVLNKIKGHNYGINSAIWLLNELRRDSMPIKNVTNFGKDKIINA